MAHYKYYYMFLISPFAQCRARTHCPKSSACAKYWISLLHQRLALNFPVLFESSLAFSLQRGLHWYTKLTFSLKVQHKLHCFSLTCVWVYMWTCIRVCVYAPRLYISFTLHPICQPSFILLHENFSFQSHEQFPYCSPAQTCRSSYSPLSIMQQNWSLTLP